MKSKALIIVAAMLLFTACATNYVVTDSVGRRLDGTRTLLTSDTLSLANTSYGLWRYTALTQSQMFDFRSKRDTMRYAYCQVLPCDGWTVVDDSLPRMLRPRVSITKRFCWFTSRYRYTAVFPALDSLPVPISQYLTDDEQRILFQSIDLPVDWNGADMYALLDKLNTKYVEWVSHCLFEKEMDAYVAHCDSAQQALLTQYHDTLLALVFASLPDEFKSIGNVATAIPELEFINKINAVGFDALHWCYEHWNLDTRVIWRVEIPGGGTAEHMVSTERLIMGDYIIEETSRTINWWACVLTLLLMVGVAWLILRGAPFGVGRLRSLQD